MQLFFKLLLQCIIMLIPFSDDVNYQQYASNSPGNDTRENSYEFRCEPGNKFERPVG